MKANLNQNYHGIGETKMSKTISIQEASNELAINLERYEWFCDTAIDGRNIVVYADRMDKEVSDVIPDYLYGYQVKLWFSDYLFCEDINFEDFEWI